MIPAIGLCLGSIHHIPITSFFSNRIQRSTYSKFRVNSNALTWLSYLLCQRSIPIRENKMELMTSLTQHYLRSQRNSISNHGVALLIFFFYFYFVLAPPGFTAVMQENGIAIGIKLLETLQIDEVDTFDKCIILYMILGMRGLIPDSSIYNMLLSPSLGLKLTDGKVFF